MFTNLLFCAMWIAIAICNVLVAVDVLPDGGYPAALNAVIACLAALGAALWVSLLRGSRTRARV